MPQKPESQLDKSILDIAIPSHMQLFASSVIMPSYKKSQQEKRKKKQYGTGITYILDIWMIWGVLPGPEKCSMF